MPSLPLLSIPLYYVLALYPHAHAVSISTRGDPKGHDNRNPKSTSHMTSLQKRLSARDFAAYERAESCHRNSLESFPIFLGALFAGLFAESQLPGSPSLGTGTFALVWMAVRLAYTVAYLQTESVQYSYVRSLLWGVGVMASFGMIGRAAFAVS